MSINGKSLELVTTNLTEKIKSVMNQYYSVNPTNPALTCKQITNLILEKSKLSLTPSDLKYLNVNVAKRIFALHQHKKVTRTSTRPYQYSISYNPSKYLPVPNIDDLSKNLIARQIEKNNQPVAISNPVKHIQLLANDLSSAQIQDTINYLTSQLFVSKEEYNKVVTENKALKIELQDFKKQWKDRVEPLVKLIEQAAKI